MPSLERFFSPIARFFDTNIKSLPNARLYFYKANSTTLKATFKDKVGDVAHANPVEADASGYFPPIFLSGLYRVELRDSSNITQPGFPVDNVGQDSAIVPFAPWSEIVTYQEDDVVTSPDGFWFRSKIDNNIGNDPDTSGAQWELIVIPIAANFTSDVSWATWSDSGTQLELNIDENGLSDGIGLRILLDDSNDLHALPALDDAGRIARYYWISSSQPANVPAAGGGYAERAWFSSSSEKLTVNLSGSDASYVATKSTTWGAWNKFGLQTDLDGKADYSTQRITLGGDFDVGQEATISKAGDKVTITSSGSLTHTSSSNPSSAAGVIPAAFRPTASVRNAYSIRAGLDIRTVLIASTGEIETQYMDFSGTATASAGTGGVISITYNIAGDIA